MSLFYYKLEYIIFLNQKKETINMKKLIILILVLILSTNYPMNSLSKDNDNEDDIIEVQNHIYDV